VGTMGTTGSGPILVGSTRTYTGVAANSHIIGVGTFADGSTQVLVDTTI
jgi:hypothetical protein